LQSDVLSLARSLFIDLITIETIVVAIIYLSSGHSTTAIAAPEDRGFRPYLLISMQMTLFSQSPL